MNSKTQSAIIDGPVGQLQIQIDEADASVPFKGIAITAHPNPVQGGTMDNKVVQTVAKAFVAKGWRSVRFNYRGVGTSAGEFANGIGETDDLLAVIKAYAPSGNICLAGFSFGTFCVTHALQALAANGRDLDADVQRIALIGSAAGKFELAPIAPGLHNRTFVLHAEADEVVTLSAVMDWARPQSLPVTVIPAGSHFFHGQLPLLKNLVLRHLA
ncbi:MAG: CocE/NonD family hydrolase [Cytophagales bacterium]|nr:CocE/NonD family hydrolase [Cytophagales bacterium]